MDSIELSRLKKKEYNDRYHQKRGKALCAKKVYTNKLKKICHDEALILDIITQVGIQNLLSLYLKNSKINI
jgi:hypothetical protein